MATDRMNTFLKNDLYYLVGVRFMSGLVFSTL